VEAAAAPQQQARTTEAGSSDRHAFPALRAALQGPAWAAPAQQVCALRSFLAERLEPAAYADITGAASRGAQAAEVLAANGASAGDDAKGNLLLADVLTGPLPGLLVAVAYPERIAQRQERGNRRVHKPPRLLPVHAHLCTARPCLVPCCAHHTAVLLFWDDGLARRLT
jgi:hypothetical protein